MMTASALMKIVEFQAKAVKEFDVRCILQLAAEIALELTGGSGAALEIAFKNEQTCRAESGAAVGNAGWPNTHSGLTALCLATGRAVRCDDTEKDVRVDGVACREAGLRSMLIAPLRQDAETLGTLGVLSGSPNWFSDQHVELLLLVSDFVAVIIRHAASMERALHNSLHDSLTGLPNRTLFRDRLGCRLADLQRKSGGLAVLCVDLDRFKQVNDRHGHQAGDKLLVAAAGRMLAEVRANDTVARLAGDEFAVLVDTGARQSAEAVAARVRMALARPFDLTVGTVKIEASVGVAFANDGDTSIDLLMQEADLAMYASKRASRIGPG